MRAEPAMAPGTQTGLAGAPSVRVWDRVVRGCHWASLVALFVALNSHGGLLSVHRIAGYALLAMLGLRIVWGFIGSRHARFADFIPRPAGLWRYAMQMLRGRAPRTMGHNPVGAMMVLALMATMFGILVTGLVLDTAAYRDHRPLHAWHDGLTDVLLVLAALHVLGVALTSLRHRENLVRAMISGDKRALAGGEDPSKLGEA